MTIIQRSYALVCWVTIINALLIKVALAVDSDDLVKRYQVIDYSGAMVVLDEPAKRVVALAPHIVENVFSAGAGDALVGVVSYSNFPVQAQDIALVGGYEKVNHERILELNPDLIIAWQSGNSYSGVQQLKDLGFTVYIDQPDELEDVAKSIRDIGILTGNTDTAEEVASTYLENINALRVEQQDKTHLSAFYQVWNKPLQTINGTHIISAAIELCGGINIYADEITTAPIINIESILTKDPDVIIASGMSSARPEWLDEWLQWKTLNAVKNDHLFFVEPDHIQRHTVRLLLGINALCLQLDSARSNLTSLE